MSASVMTPHGAATLEGEWEGVWVRVHGWLGDGILAGTGTVRISVRSPRRSESVRLLEGMMTLVEGPGDERGAIRLEPLPGSAGRVLWEWEVTGELVSRDPGDRWRQLRLMMAVLG